MKPRPIVLDRNGKPKVLTLKDVEAHLGPTSSVVGRCRCHREFQPIHLVLETSMSLASQLADVAPDLTLLTYRCGRCKGIAQITTGALGLARR